jgi:endonuclease G
MTTPEESSSVAGKTATWNLPLTVSVSLGNPTLSFAPPADAQSAVAQPAAMAASSVPVAAVDKQPAVVVATDDEPTADDIKQAREAVERASTRTDYYDAEKDQADRTAYYSGISATLSPAQLFDALSNLVKSTHKNKLGYKPMVHLYPWVDLQPSRKIKSVYSLQTFNPIELIERDQEVARMREERITHFRTTESAESPAAMATFLEAMEAQLAFNCEHVVPQSWFNKRQPMKGDLHHLFACESGCNSFRSNTPYFDFSDFNEAVRSDCGKSDTNKFEPTAGKGPVARATLYFLLRYPGEINATSNEYTADRLEVLLKWHKENPVTEYELHRNQAIFESQGNRNPLIDHPEWTTSIGFANGLA